MLEESKVNRLIGIGTSLNRQKLFEKNESIQVETYESTDDFLKQLDSSSFNNEVILLKGACKFRFEVIGIFGKESARNSFGNKPECADS